MKRILLCTFMLCCCISSLFAQMGTWTDENGVRWEFQTNGNEATITRAYNYGTEVVVPGKVTMEWPDANVGSITQEYTVTDLESEVFWEGRENLTKVILPSTIKTIGAWVFSNCPALTSVENLSNCTSIGDYAFQSCSVLTSVDLSSCTSIGDYAFNSCSAMTSVDLSACESIGEWAFQSCSVLTSVGDLSNCTSIGNAAFQNCSALTSVDLSNCESLGKQAFDVCKNLTSIGSLSKCKTMGDYAFAVCEKLEEVGDLSNCTSMGIGVFALCSSLKSVDVSHLTSIKERMFDGCSALTSVGDLSACTTIESSAFKGCTALTSVGDLSACTSIKSHAFNGCSALTSVGDLSACTTIEYEAFRGCSALTSVDLSNCKTIGDNAFNQCLSLVNIDLSNCTIIGEFAFTNCSSLTNVEDLSSCTTIGNAAFQYCSSLTNIGGLSKCTTLGWNAFQYCSSLTSVGDLSNCTTIENYVFDGCSSLTSIGDLSNCTTIGNGAFSSCSSLTSIGDLSNCATIGNGTFSSCSSLASIGDLSSCTTIGESAFYGCSSLASIGDLSSCITIRNNAFAYCDALEGCINLSNVKNIGAGVFSSNNRLKEIIIDSTTPIILTNLYSLPGQGVIRVPAEALETYLSADIWKDPQIANRIVAMTDPIDYDVTTTAMTSESGLGRLFNREDMRKVVTLKVSGTINSYDIISMNNKMTNLRCLDLTDVTIVDCEHGYYTGYGTTDNVVGSHMFYDQDKYLSIKLPKNAERIDDHAFFGCGNLTNVTLYKGIKSIGSNAFDGCDAIKEMIIPMECESIGSFAFFSCDKLKTLAFSSTLKEIYDYAFSGCSSLTKITLPKELNSIGYAAFSGCSNLEELRIPSSVIRIDNEAFRYCEKLNKVYTYTLEPTSIAQETFSTYASATLYVPKTSYTNYEYNTEWSQFVNYDEFDEEYEYFYINKDYVLDDNTGVVSGKPDGDLNPGSGFIQEGSEDQEMGDVHIKDDGNCSGSIIGNGNINADNLFFDMTIEGGRWYFFCFPFKINLSDITCPGQHVWRKYDGEKRAEEGQGGWVDLDADEDHLKKGYGYIFQASQSGTLTLKVTKENFGKFENADHHQAVEELPADDENNASWNFMGNPHTSYYGIGEMGYDAPITIWTGTTYEAVRPGDDDYYLKPFQAFFVQKPEGTSEIVFDADNKVTYNQAQDEQKKAQARRMARGINPDRLLVNLTLTDGTHTDKTRVVFNDKQSMGYEMACDAAKFMSTEGTPQLYTLDNKHIRYAINERPNGDVTMGYSVSKEGTYTISVARMDKPMVLRDLEMGITFDLSNGDYTFTSKAGTNEKRFVLSANQSETGIADIMKETGVNIMAVEGGIHISGLNGQMVYIYDLSGAAIATQTTDGTAAVKAGTYVIKVDNLSTKLLVK